MLETVTEEDLRVALIEVADASRASRRDLRWLPRSGRRRLATWLAVAVVVLLVALIAGVSAVPQLRGHTREGGAGPVPPAPGAPLVVTLRLSATTVRADESLDASLVFDNRLTTDIAIPGCVQNQISVGLTNATTPFEFVTPLVLCLPRGELPPGVTVLHSPLSARQQFFANSCASGSSCVPVAPPLPPGSYETKAYVELTLPAGTLLPGPIPVTVTGT